jgi:hypothetical protein
VGALLKQLLLLHQLPKHTVLTFVRYWLAWGYPVPYNNIKPLGIMPMDSMKSASKPTFAMLMERIAADPDLSATHKHSLLCSIRCYTKMLGQHPARMVVDRKD